MDVQGEDVHAQCDRSYSLHEVTGWRFSVHAVLITQSLTANVLTRSCEKIEHFNLEEFWFMSSCAIVESVGCAMLLIMLKYPLAQIRLNTRQTIDEARSLGMICKGDPS